jgi:hypothetical protein
MDNKPILIDGTIKSPTIIADGNIIMDNGQFRLE